MYLCRCTGYICTYIEDKWKVEFATGKKIQEDQEEEIWPRLYLTYINNIFVFPCITVTTLNYDLLLFIVYIHNFNYSSYICS